MKNTKKKLKGRAVFLDRDGVINHPCYYNDRGIYSPRDLEEFKLIKGVKESIKAFKKAGFKVIVVSNQPGVVFGYIRKEKLDEIDDFMIKKLKVDAVYNCLHHPEYTGDCSCRKPKDGLLKKAAREWKIDISRSYMVGDDLSDIKAGHKCKETFLIIKKMSIPILNFMEDMQTYPSHMVKSLKEAARIILSPL